MMLQFFTVVHSKLNWMEARKMQISVSISVLAGTSIAHLSCIVCGISFLERHSIKLEAFASVKHNRGATGSVARVRRIDHLRMSYDRPGSHQWEGIDWSKLGDAMNVLPCLRHVSLEFVNKEDKEKFECEAAKKMAILHRSKKVRLSYWDDDLESAD